MAVYTHLGAEVLGQLVAEFDPDVMLLDVDLGSGPNGIHLAHVLNETRPDIAVLILTKYPDARSASRDGIELPPNVGFLRKHLVSDTAYLLKALEKVLADKSLEEGADTPIWLATRWALRGNLLAALRNE